MENSSDTKVIAYRIIGFPVVRIGNSFRFEGFWWRKSSAISAIRTTSLGHDDLDTFGRPRVIFPMALLKVGQSFIK